MVVTVSLVFCNWDMVVTVSLVFCNWDMVTTVSLVFCNRYGGNCFTGVL